MDKSIVFISHYAEEKEFAQLLGTFIENCFYNNITCFISSYTLELGDAFLDKIRNNFTKSDIVLVLCSPTSIQRPWICAEAGASFFTGKLCIPICHSGLEFKDLPPFFDKLQGTSFKTANDAQTLIEKIGKVTQCSNTIININEFITSILTLETQYTFWNRLIAAFSNILVAICNSFGGNTFSLCLLWLIDGKGKIAFHRDDFVIAEINKATRAFPDIFRSGFIDLPNTGLSRTGYIIELKQGYYDLKPDIYVKLLNSTLPVQRVEIPQTKKISIRGKDADGKPIDVQVLFYEGGINQPNETTQSEPH
ncbi:toll/interleukin-1 receptor domain-containing protein [Treponema primitia]|uniref:toll/interleukin-1 receptor domain-containing protein n=1 Tax=Treponema primitia TaxID=88058 RepID=UPI0002555887|nr:toll/interleukin-1 receptor domain-containing protein [Treponema primitia]